MKTDDEIKLGLELCSRATWIPRGRCPYAKDCLECGSEGRNQLKKDALALINRLEEEKMCMRIQMHGDCSVCKHEEVEFGCEPCDSCIDNPKRPSWEYKGLPEVKKK